MNRSKVAPFICCGWVPALMLCAKMKCLPVTCARRAAVLGVRRSPEPAQMSSMRCSVAAYDAFLHACGCSSVGTQPCHYTFGGRVGHPKKGVRHTLCPSCRSRKLGRGRFVVPGAFSAVDTRSLKDLASAREGTFLGCWKL